MTGIKSEEPEMTMYNPTANHGRYNDDDDVFS